jgi:hypothetical protein
VILFLLVSMSLSGLVATGTGANWWRGLGWVEVVLGVWLVVRVSLTQLGFGTFGGWKARPVSRWGFYVSEGLFVLVSFLLASGARVVATVAIVRPDEAGWVIVWENWFTTFAWLGAFFGVSKVIGMGWERSEARARPRLAEGVALALVVGGVMLSEVNSGGRSWGGNGLSYFPSLDPRGLEGVEDWEWLRSDYYVGHQLEAAGAVQLGLHEGSVVERDGVKITLEEVKREGDCLVVEVEFLKVADFYRDSGKELQPSLMVEYGNGYFGDRWQGDRRGSRIRLPLLRINRLKLTAKIFSPMVLPENEDSWDEVMEGAKLWVGFVNPDESDEGVRNAGGELSELKGQLARTGVAGGGGAKVVSRMVEERGAEVMDEVLAAAPWSEGDWNGVVERYLLKFAREEDAPKLLGMLERNPWMGDFFMKKGWGELAEAGLREHLEEGKSLGPLSVIYLAELGEEEMGEALGNQLLRMSGGIDVVAAAVKGHPGVSWDEVQREAWRRVATGFGSYHVWVQWGAETGEKEALRRLLVEASAGKKWEREILEGWFGKDGDVVERLRGRWEAVRFEEGRWMFEGG